MSQNAIDTLSDDTLIRMATPAGGGDAASAGGKDDGNFSDSLLMSIAQQRLSDSIDTQSGAPAGIRAQVAAAQRQEDKLTTLKQFFPDAVPVEVFDPEFGAAKFGRGNFVFTNPENGQLTLFDEDIRIFGIPVPTLGDFADVGPEIAETVGGLGGGAIGAAGAATLTAPTIIGSIPAATAGFVVGEGLGSATAREMYINILDYFGETEDNRTGLERLGDFSTTAAINAAAGPIVSKVIDGVKFVAGAPIRYASRAMSVPAKEAFERMASAGVTAPTLGQVTGSPLFNLIENSVLANLPTSTVTMRNAAQQTIRQIDEATQNLAEKFGGARTTSDAAYRVMDAAQAARARYDEKVSAMYREVGNLIPDGLTSEAKNTVQFVQKYLADSKTATGKDDLGAALRQAEKVMLDAKNGALSYDRLKDFRSSLMKTVRKAESQGALDKSEQRVKELIGYVTRDLDDLVGSAGSRQMDLFDEKTGSSLGQQILDKYKAANSFVSQNQKKGGNIAFIDDVIKRGESEATGALRYVLSGSKEGAERIEKLRSQFTPEEFEVLSGYMLGKMGTPTPSAMGVSEIGEAAAREGAEVVSDAGFSPARFLTNWNNLSPEAKQALFNGTEYKDLVPKLDDLVFTIERVGKAASDMSNPSGTGRAVAAMGMLGVLGADTAFGRMMGSDGFEYGFGSLIGPYAGAKLMTNPDFVKWLTVGVEKSVYNPKSFGQHVRRLGQIFEVNPDIRDEVRGVLQGLTQETIEPLPTESSKSSNDQASVPQDNELRFRTAVPKSTADKVLPRTDELMARAQSMTVPQVGAPEEDIFEPLPEASPQSQFSVAESPTVLPNPQDREIAMRLRGPLGGIASLT